MVSHLEVRKEKVDEKMQGVRPNCNQMAPTDPEPL